MARADNLHSRVVAWLKVILPLIALGLLSTLFLVARTGDPDLTLPFSKQDLQEMASDQRVNRPNFAGLTQEGRPIEIAAEAATPRNGDMNVVDAVQMTGRLVTRDGGTIDVVSDEGTVFARDSRAYLRGNVRIQTSSGYVIDTDALTTALDRTDMATDGPVTAEGPLGTIDAGRMVVTPGPADSEDSVSVVFKDGVKLIYLPQNQ